MARAPLFSAQLLACLILHAATGIDAEESQSDGRFLPNTPLINVGQQGRNSGDPRSKPFLIQRSDGSRILLYPNQIPDEYKHLLGANTQVKPGQKFPDLSLKTKPTSNENNERAAASEVPESAKKNPSPKPKPIDPQQNVQQRSWSQYEPARAAHSTQPKEESQIVPSIRSETKQPAARGYPAPRPVYRPNSRVPSRPAQQTSRQNQQSNSNPSNRRGQNANSVAQNQSQNNRPMYPHSSPELAAYSYRTRGSAQDRTPKAEKTRSQNEDAESHWNRGVTRTPAVAGNRGLKYGKNPQRSSSNVEHGEHIDELLMRSSTRKQMQPNFANFQPGLPTFPTGPNPFLRPGQRGQPHLFQRLVGSPVVRPIPQLVVNRGPNPRPQPSPPEQPKRPSASNKTPVVQNVLVRPPQPPNPGRAFPQPFPENPKPAPQPIPVEAPKPFQIEQAPQIHNPYPVQSRQQYGHHRLLIQPYPENYCDLRHYSDEDLAARGLQRVEYFIANISCSSYFFACGIGKTFLTNCTSQLEVFDIDTGNCNFRYNVKTCPEYDHILHCTIREQCGPDQFACCASPQQCIHYAQRCDGIPDCADGEDENNCPACLPDQFPCVKSGKCISWEKHCDGVPDDCFDQSNLDEYSCTTCQPNQFLCSRSGGGPYGSPCLELSQRCNGVKECTYGEDELSCRTEGSKYLLCENQKQSVSRENWCNGVPDCLDQSDEHYCIY